MHWIYKALAITALITRLIIIYENAEKFNDRRRARKTRKKHEQSNEDKVSEY